MKREHNKIAILTELRNKWHIVPGDISQRLSVDDMLALSDDELSAKWRSVAKADTTGSGFAVRGWFHTLYKEFMRDKRVLEIGQGIGIDTFTFSSYGAKVTCADIVDKNLDLIKRLSGLLEQDVKTLYIESFDSFSTIGDFDVIYACGSLHNAPFDFMKEETAMITPHLTTGGRWIQLAYPKERWMRDGSPAFELWGERTDGHGTPYAEWYDLEKLMKLLYPAKFDVVLSFNFHNDEFIWFDLIKR